jgi:hypothetical protein
MLPPLGCVYHIRVWRPLQLKRRVSHENFGLDKCGRYYKGTFQITRVSTRSLSSFPTHQPLRLAESVYAFSKLVRSDSSRDMHMD